MTTKTYLSAQELLEDSFKLGAKIVASGFEPTVIIAIWRGGGGVGGDSPQPHDEEANV